MGLKNEVLFKVLSLPRQVLDGPFNQTLILDERAARDVRNSTMGKENAVLVALRARDLPLLQQYTDTQQLFISPEDKSEEQSAVWNPVQKQLQTSYNFWPFASLNKKRRTMVDFFFQRIKKELRQFMSSFSSEVILLLLCLWQMR